MALAIDGQPLRVFGSTGQLRSAAIALKLLELATLRERRGIEPALLLDDVFAELDSERQRRLATRLMGDGQRQLFVTAPRADELPPQLDLPRWDMNAGRARPRWRIGMSDEEARGSRKRAPAPIGDTVAAWLGRTGIGARVAQATIIVDWPRLVGEQIAAVTEAESITPDGLLRVRVATAAWANELSLMTPQIIARLNAGRQGRIRGIRWIATGPGTRPSP